MWFLDSLRFKPPRYPQPDPGTALTSQRLLLRTGDAADWRDWRYLREASRAFLTPWEPSWPPNALDYAFFCGVLRRHWLEWRQGRGYSFLIFSRTGAKAGKGALLGGISLNMVERGVNQKATLGYWLGEAYANQGYMTEAANLVCGFAFNTLKLHRVEASCLPQNEPSKKLLRRLGFVEEGFAKNYLQINGEWRDHLLWGKNVN